MLGQQDSVSEASNDTGGAPAHNGESGANGATQQQPLILVTAAASGCVGQWNLNHRQRQLLEAEEVGSQQIAPDSSDAEWVAKPQAASRDSEERQQQQQQTSTEAEEDGEQVEEIDGIKYRILAAVTKPVGLPAPAPYTNPTTTTNNDKNSAHCVIVEQRAEEEAEAEDWPPPEVVGHAKNAAAGYARPSGSLRVASGSLNRRFGSAIRRKSSALVTSLAKSLSSSPEPGKLGTRRLSILELTKSPPPETLLEVYLNERRRSSSHSAKQVQIEQQTTFEANYCQRQQYFKDLNLKLINHDKKLLNVVANRGQIHRHSVDIAQLPLHLAQAKAQSAAGSSLQQQQQQQQQQLPLQYQEAIHTSEQASHLNSSNRNQHRLSGSGIEHESPGEPLEPRKPINQFAPGTDNKPRPEELANREQLLAGLSRTQTRPQSPMPDLKLIARPTMDKRSSISSRGDKSRRKSRIVIRRFQKLDQTQLNSTPAPDVKIGQRVSYKEYYGNEFGTIRWIGRVPQICPDWTAGIEFDNAIGEGDGSLLGRRYFTAKDCFAKFLPLDEVAFVDQHVGRPEPGTMISVMSAAVQPGQMISIQRVSTVHVQNCFLNAPHQVAGADILAVNTRLHCQCPSCGPCAHIIKPPRTQRLSRSKKNATHMCQFSTYTCCGMKSQEEAVCTYKGNKVASLPPPMGNSSLGLPPIGNSWIEGAGYLTNLQAAQSALMPEEYRMGVAPEDRVSRRPSSKNSIKRSSSRKHYQAPSDQTEKGPILTTDNITYDEPSKPAIACARKLSPDNIKNNKLYEEKNLAVVHRDSIENRYLFPTEEPMDSTLEADLEDLSEARYGHHLYSSRGILKSLRSLVSCLNVRASNSELDRRSEDTLRYSEYAKSGHNKSMPAESSDSHKKNSDYQGSEKPHHHTGFQSDNKNTNGGINQMMKGQISSSSDCGFSSASQNSINFFPKCPTALASEADKENFISQLTSITDEDLIRLKRALYEPQRTTNYFLHNTSVNLMSNASHDTFEDKHLFAEKLQKLISTPAFGCEQSYKSPSRASCCSENKIQIADYSSLDNTADQNRRSVDDDNHSIRTNMDKLKARNDSRSSTSASFNLSSCDDSLVSTTAMGLDPLQNHNDVTSEVESNDQMVDHETLANAFELKLTLSINSDKFKAQIKNQKNEPETVLTSSSCGENNSNVSGSTLKINIMSNDPIDHTNSNSKTVTQQ